jgi:hypothetical protein
VLFPTLILACRDESSRAHLADQMSTRSLRQFASHILDTVTAVAGGQQPSLTQQQSELVSLTHRLPLATVRSVLAVLA